MASRTYHHGDVPKAAVAQALTMVEAQGEGALTMRALAKAIGVDHRALYRHYKDRQDVLAEVAAEGYRRLLALQLAKPDRFDHPLHSAFEVYVCFALEHPHLHALMLSRSRSSIEGCAVLNEAVNAELDHLMSCARLALGVQKDASDTDARDLAMGVLAAAYGLVSLAATATLMPRTPDDLRVFILDQIEGVLSGQLMRFGAR